MRTKQISCILLAVSVAALSVCSLAWCQSDDDAIISYKVDIKKQNLQMYWKDDGGNIFKNFQNIQAWLAKKNKKLLFAMNGGMFKPDYSPRGLFITNKNTVTPLDTTSGAGNFYLKPNGVFYTTTNNRAVICKTEDFVHTHDINFATQSGPILVANGQIHSAFKQGSTNVNIRNGVGILPDSTVIFAISKKPINFYDFANYFQRLGCKNALYLDGFVSRIYLPEQNIAQMDGNFGVMIAVVSKEE